MIKAHLFIEGYSLKNRCNTEHGFIRSPLQVGLETFYTALLILTIEQLLSSINALPKTFQIPTESRILRSFGYRQATLLPDVSFITWENKIELTP
ncbi:MAG: hypothetical protein QNK36_12840 [Colwellia sp.]|nr:hypothetical protein [Colwellia sp.]